MRNIKLLVQYDGTNYHGWQVQTSYDTIQGRINEALQTMVTSFPVKCTGASRTDAGVHAMGQVVNFRIPSNISISCAGFYHGLNSLTPEDIIISEVQETTPEFHARFDARAKTYGYQIWNADAGSAYHLRFAWHLKYKLNVPAMRLAARHLLGCHDFKSFQASSCEAETTIRTISAIHILVRRQMVRVIIKANAYLQRMVRNIVGTLVEVGTGRISPDAVLRILQGKDRTLAGVTAPAHGLFLLKVHYREAQKTF
jgi:tRNA pseudouridine38-40 synthase